MTKKILLPIFELLESIPAKRQSVVEQQQKSQNQIRELTQLRANCSDAIDAASYTERIEYESSRAAQLGHEVKRYDRALEAAQEDMFGFCSECGWEIELARMNHEPSTTTCVTCKSIKERKASLIRAV